MSAKPYLVWIAAVVALAGCASEVPTALETTSVAPISTTPPSVTQVLGSSIGVALADLEPLCQELGEASIDASSLLTSDNLESLKSKTPQEALDYLADNDWAQELSNLSFTVDLHGEIETFVQSRSIALDLTNFRSAQIAETKQKATDELKDAFLQSCQAAGVYEKLATASQVALDLQAKADLVPWHPGDFEIMRDVAWKWSSGTCDQFDSCFNIDVVSKLECSNGIRVSIGIESLQGQSWGTSWVSRDFFPAREIRTVEIPAPESDAMGVFREVNCLGDSQRTSLSNDSALQLSPAYFAMPGSKILKGVKIEDLSCFSGFFQTGATVRVRFGGQQSADAYVEIVWLSKENVVVGSSYGDAKLFPGTETVVNVRYPAFTGMASTCKISEIEAYGSSF